MHLFLIRHGETEHNVAGLLAGVTDSRLTNHGVSQTQRLGNNLINDRCLRFTNVYSSDLQRAYMTANEICKAQNSLPSSTDELEVVKLEMLREQDFGSFELMVWSAPAADRGTDSRVSDPLCKPKETHQSMKTRADTFIDDFLVPLLAVDVDADRETRVAVVSHGIFLGHLWRALVSRLHAGNVSISSNVATADPTQPLMHMSWSNTGCLELEIKLVPTNISKADPGVNDDVTNEEYIFSFETSTLTVMAINDKQHLLNLKRARGGIGSAAYDERQLNLHNFFKKQKKSDVEPPHKVSKSRAVASTRRSKPTKSSKT